MISVLNHLPQLSGNRVAFIFFGFILCLMTTNLQAQDPHENYRTHFLIHKARKGDTIFSLTKRYEISVKQLLYYNPELKDGLKKGRYDRDSIEEDEKKKERLLLDDETHRLILGEYKDVIKAQE